VYPLDSVSLGLDETGPLTRTQKEKLTESREKKPLHASLERLSSMERTAGAGRSAARDGRFGCGKREWPRSRAGGPFDRSGGRAAKDGGQRTKKVHFEIVGGARLQGTGASSFARRKTSSNGRPRSELKKMFYALKTRTGNEGEGTFSVGMKGKKEDLLRVRRTPTRRRAPSRGKTAAQGSEPLKVSPGKGGGLLFKSEGKPVRPA